MAFQLLHASIQNISVAHQMESLETHYYFGLQDPHLLLVLLELL
uniref:Uncharacterized protein n=1 Tax=Arundo donax TaxID=35708 RepID=A0A0A9G2T1_ARUDO